MAKSKHSALVRPHPGAAQQPASPTHAKPNRRAGWVYLIGGEGDAYKIGCTKAPSNRMKTFKNKLPFRVRYEHLIETDDMYQLERLFHNYYKVRGKHLEGEWFRLSERDIAYIKTFDYIGFGANASG